VAEPQPKERGQPCPREGNDEEETRGQGCPRCQKILAAHVDSQGLQCKDVKQAVYFTFVKRCFFASETFAQEHGRLLKILALKP